MERDFEKALCLGSGIIYLFFLLSISVPNGLILVVLYRNPLLCFRKAFSVFLIFITAVDFLNGIAVCSGQVIMRYLCAFGDGRIPHEGDIVMVLEYIGINGSILLVTAMAVDRFISIVYPHFYLCKVKSRKIVLYNLVICAFSSIFGALQLVPGLSMNVYRVIDLHLNMTFPLATTILAYLGMFFFMKKRSRDVDLKRRATMRNAELHAMQRLQRVRMERKFALTSFFILLFLILSLIPYFIASAVEARCHDCQDRKWFFVFKESCFLFLFINSMVNPFLATFRIKELKQSVKIVLRLRQQNNQIGVPLRRVLPSNKVIDGTWL